MVCRENPHFLVYRALRKNDNGYGSSNDFLYVALRVLEEKPGRCLIYGASELGRQANRLFRLLGIPVAGFVDRNPTLWGKIFDNAVVFSPAEAGSLEFDAVVIGSTLFAASIAKDIRNGVIGHKPELKLYSTILL